MRIDKRIKRTATDIVNKEDEKSLADLIYCPSENVGLSIKLDPYTCGLAGCLQSLVQKLQSLLGRSLWYKYLILSCLCFRNAVLSHCKIFICIVFDLSGMIFAICYMVEVISVSIACYIRDTVILGFQAKMLA